MIDCGRRFLAGAFFMLLLTFGVRAGADDARYAGRPVVDVLLELREPGLDFIYSSELIPATLRVETEPRSSGKLPLAVEILAAHGLTLSVVRPGLYAVVAQVPAPAPDAEAAASETHEAGPPGTRLSEVVVSTSRYAFDRYREDGSVNIDGDALAAQPVIGEDAIRALGRLPGMAQGGLSAQASIRGGESGETLTLLDGFPLRQAFHLSGYHSLFGVLEPGLIDDAEIFTGGFPVRYGNRMGGVFDLETIDADHEPRTALGISVFNALARRAGRVDAAGADWLGAARVGTLRPFIDAFAHDAGRPTYSDAYARVGYGEPDRLRMTANFLWTRDELSISREGHGEQAEIESKNHYLWLRAERDWGERLQSSMWLGYSGIGSFREGALDSPEISSGSVRDRRASDYLELRGRVAWQPNPRNWLEGGFEWTDESAHYRYAASALYSDQVAALFGLDPAFERVIELSPERERIALFASHRWQATEAIVSELGLRAARTITRGTTAESWLFDPRASLRWQVAATTDLRLHWGRFHQTDEVHELKVEDGLAMFPEAQRSDHVIVGLDHRLGGGIALRVEAFRKEQTDPRPHFENLLDPLTLIPEIAPDRIEVAPTSAEIRGVEISVVGEQRDLAWWAGVSWSEAFDRVAGENVPRSWDQSWAANGGIDWTLGRWRFGAAAGAHRGWPTTRLVDGALTPRNQARFGTRGTLDLRAEYRMPLTVGRLAVTLEVSNALNIANTCCQALRAVDDGAGGVTFITRESDWLPVVPSVGVLWEF